MQGEFEKLMKIIAQKYKDGSLTLLEAPAPGAKAGGVLVRTTYSVISTGTELMKVAESKLSLLGKARARPDQVKKVLQSVAQQGPVATLNKVFNRLDAYTPLGYSLSGVVVDVGSGVDGIKVGDRVACMGNQYALHAELNWVPVNMCARLSPGVDDAHGAFGTVGAISMQGFRQSDLKLGEVAVVIGLGLLGQIVVRILKTAGVHVFGVDLDPARCQLALEGGAAAAASPGSAAFDGLADALKRKTAGAGADCVLITAGGGANGPVELAADLLRDRGRVVDVGKCGMNLPWDAYAAKELELRFSRSYGPGRYDPTYEEDGIDYPIGYVRWTQQRNLEAFLSLIEDRRIDLSPLISTVHPFEDAVSVYEQLNAGELNGIGVLFRYTASPNVERVLGLRSSRAATSGAPQRVGVIGCGAYASSMLMPHLKDRESIRLVEVATSTGLSAANAKEKFGFERMSTDPRALIAADDIDAIMIFTPHASHGAFVASALRAGKSVFVEKPLAITLDDLRQVIEAVEETGNDRLMVGFNRRFAPSLVSLRDAFGPGEPATLLYRVNAGRLEGGGWHGDRVRQGGRFVGEGCHFVDTASWWLGARPLTVTAVQAGPDPDHLFVTTRYDNGGICVISYVTDGDPRYPKETLEVSGRGRTARMDNFQRFQLWWRGARKTIASGGGKGQKEEMAALTAALTSGFMPIDLQSLVDTTLVTFAAEQSAATGRTVALADVLAHVQPPI